VPAKVPRPGVASRSVSGVGTALACSAVEQ
jgi:hypothetical protein